MKIKFKTLFFPDAGGRLRMRVRYSGNVVHFNVGYTIDKSKWNGGDVQRCKNGTSHNGTTASEINRTLQRFENQISDLFKQYEVKDQLPTLEQVRTAFNVAEGRIEEKETRKSLFHYLDLFIETESKDKSWTAGTTKKFTTLKNHLKDFSSELYFESFTKETLKAYTDFLIDDCNFRNTTARKNIKLLKWFLRWGFAEAYNTENAFLTFDPKFKEVSDTQIIFLTWDELMKVHNYNVPDKYIHLDKVKDCFLFSCFTGLRHSDVFALRRCDVKEDYITLVTVKTNDTLSIPLNKYSKSILDKYKDFPLDGKALPCITNQKSNEYLKDLMKLVGIDDPITKKWYRGPELLTETLPKYSLIATHTGRRTFISNAIMMGIPPETVMKFTGHKDYKSMQPYIAIADLAKREAMNIFDNK
ncbi:phage integrase SAM-like domain-containing protein [Macellibacteroides fermentans]|uniref:phage integrase SAM-like domain-containing protein n=1 Tax=Macellibacteroides fermentans TaxID=879969 RepID=UPI002B3DA834|nr:phage integrase SAM-like domain-containing protein [Macellibacteroides fermentans]